MSYLEFRNHAICFDAEKRTLRCFFFGASGRKEAALEELSCTVIPAKGRKAALTEYPVCEEIQLPSVRFPAMPALGHWDLTLRLSDPQKKLPMVTLGFRLFADRIEFSALGAAVRWHGIMDNGEDAEHDLFAGTSASRDALLYCASGPASHTAATMLYNRREDSALKCCGGTMALAFDWEKGKYACDFTVQDASCLSFCRAEKICQTLFSLPTWAPLSREHQFPVPPVGWMSWYSLRFDTCEATVLENARRMCELFRNFAEKICIWVDWEWCHADLSGRGCDGVDVFHPRKDAYPHGLKYVSDAIRALGEIPALWCGATVEGRMNRFMEAHPETVLADFLFWPGHFWLDLTNPLVFKEYIPEVFRQFLAWGYEVFKWDCWLNTLRVNDEFHDRCCQPDRSLESCIQELVSAARRVIGPERYLLGCTIDDRPSLGGGALYDGFRVGGDVFSWQDFRANGVNNTCYYYPLHNTRLYLDPDTLVLRNEYSDDRQAATRVAFLALTGLQLTVGDPLNALDDKRIDMLKRAMPVVSVHPVEFCSKAPPPDLFQTLTAVARPFGEWYVSGNFNFDRRRRKAKIRYRTMGLPAGKYAAFEFWGQRLLNISASGTDIPLNPGESAAVRLTAVGEDPVLIGSSRHLLQGAVELTALSWDGKKAELSGETVVVGGDPVTLTFYLPERWSVIPQQGVTSGESLVHLTLAAKKNTTLKWCLRFQKK